MMIETYVSTDIETDGPVAGQHSMLSIGSAAYSADRQLLGTFSANLETLPTASADAATTAWWATQPAAWAACRSNPEAPHAVMTRYVTWLKALPGKPVFVAYPAEWFDPLPHTHVALDDAIEQGSLFCNMLRTNLKA